MAESLPRSSSSTTRLGTNTGRTTKPPQFAGAASVCLTQYRPLVFTSRQRGLLALIAAMLAVAGQVMAGFPHQPTNAQVAWLGLPSSSLVLQVPWLEPSRSKNLQPLFHLD